MADRPQNDTSLETLRVLNIDAVTRWFYRGMPVDGLRRRFLPAHITSPATRWRCRRSGLIGLAEDVTASMDRALGGILLGLGLSLQHVYRDHPRFRRGPVLRIRLVQQRAWRNPALRDPPAPRPCRWPLASARHSGARIRATIC